MSHTIGIWYGNAIHCLKIILNSLHFCDCLQNEETSSPLLKYEVNQAVSTSLRKKQMRLKELVVALELSKNEAILGDLLKWTETEMEKPVVAAPHVMVTASQPYINVIKQV